MDNSCELTDELSSFFDDLKAKKRNLCSSLKGAFILVDPQNKEC